MIDRSDEGQAQSTREIERARLADREALTREISEVRRELPRIGRIEEAVELREEEEEELREREEEGIKEEEELPADMEEVDWDALLDDQFDAGAYNSERTEYDPNWEADREPQENRITAMPPLLEHLYRQLGEIGGLGPEERAIAEYIIGNIDERGYVGC